MLGIRVVCDVQTRKAEGWGAFENGDKSENGTTLFYSIAP